MEEMALSEALDWLDRAAGFATLPYVDIAVRVVKQHLGVDVQCPSCGTTIPRTVIPGYADGDDR